MDNDTATMEAAIPRAQDGWEGGAASGLHPTRPRPPQVAPGKAAIAPPEPPAVAFDADGWPDLGQRPVPAGGRVLRDTRAQMQALQRWAARGCHVGIGMCCAALWLLVIELHRVDEWLLLPGILLLFFVVGAVRASAPLPPPTQTKFFSPAGRARPGA